MHIRQDRLRSLGNREVNRHRAIVVRSHDRCGYRRRRESLKPVIRLQGVAIRRDLGVRDSGGPAEESHDE